MEAQTVTLILGCCATAHFTITCVAALYARHKVQYLSLAWIMGIFSFMVLGMAFYADEIAGNDPGILHPAVLMMLVVTSYLQSIYPLSFTLPGYLQMGRMLRYASPAFILVVLYSLLMLFAKQVEKVDTLRDWITHPFSADLWLRMAALLLSVYYIANIFRLPHRESHNVEIPRYTYVYSILLGLSALLFCFISVHYSATLYMLYIIIFTSLNLYLSFRTLETMALNLPRPVIEEVNEEPSEDELRKAEEDFNQLNLQRYNRLQYWMQQHREAWIETTFGRDQLCREVGLNRHFVLQALRSQGYNNVHDYINSYRIDHLKRLITRHQVTTLTACLDAGFGTIKTARTCFERHETTTLDDFLAAANAKAKAKSEESVQTK